MASLEQVQNIVHRLDDTSLLDELMKRKDLLDGLQPTNQTGRKTPTGAPVSQPPSAQTTYAPTSLPTLPTQKDLLSNFE